MLSRPRAVLTAVAGVARRWASTVPPAPPGGPAPSPSPAAKLAAQQASSTATSLASTSAAKQAGAVAAQQAARPSSSAEPVTMATKLAYLGLAGLGGLVFYEFGRHDSPIDAIVKSPPGQLEAMSFPERALARAILLSKVYFLRVAFGSPRVPVAVYRRPDRRQAAAGRTAGAVPAAVYARARSGRDAGSLRVVGMPGALYICVLADAMSAFALSLPGNSVKRAG